MIFEAQTANPDPTHESRLLQDCVDQAVLAEEMGFDRIWAVEHHGLKWYAHMSASEIFLSFVAARTQRIRIGHGVVCMPFNFNHPIRTAERTAMLDVLSGGRLDVGAGRGATAQETALYNVDPDATYTEVEESLRILGRAWQEETFEWHGKLLDIAPPPDGQITILPRPQQHPHPPLYMACTKESSLKLAAEYGIGALVLGFAGPEQVARLRKAYDDAIAERTGENFVSTEVNDRFVALCPTTVLDDRERAIKTGIRGQRFFAQSIAHWYGSGPVPDGVVREGVDEAAAMKEAEEQMVAYLHEAQIPVRPNSTANYNADHAYGTPKDAISYVEQLEAAGADEIMCLIQMGTIDQETCTETIRQWGRHVIPHFRARERG